MKRSDIFQTISCAALIAGTIQLGWSAAHAPGQAQASTSSAAQAVSSSAAMASTQGQSAELRNGTKISADLMSSVDARKAKPGDKVVARVTKNVKQHGKTVVHKGDKLIGHVTNVQAAANGKAGSALGVKFDQLVAGHSTTQLNTVLTSILSVPGSNGGGREPMEPISMPAPVAAPAGGGGGLLGGGGVGATVGSAAGLAGSAVGGAGSTVGGVGGTLGAATQSSLGAHSGLNLSTPARQIHLQSQASANQSTGLDSVMATRQGNLRLESGTRMQFRVAADSNAQTKR